MRGLPHIAENFKIDIFEARFFPIAPTPFMPTPNSDSQIDVRKEWICKFCSETNVWTRWRCRRCHHNIPSGLEGKYRRAVSTNMGRSSSGSSCLEIRRQQSEICRRKLIQLVRQQKVERGRARKANTHAEKVDSKEVDEEDEREKKLDEQRKGCKNNCVGLTSSQILRKLHRYCRTRTQWLCGKCRHWNCALILSVFTCVDSLRPSGFRSCFPVPLHVVRLNSLRMISR